MEISEMKNGGRYRVAIEANGSVWKKIKSAADAQGETVNKFMIDCARTGWKSVDLQSPDCENVFDLYPGLQIYLETHDDSVSVNGLVKFLGVKPPVALNIMNSLIKNGIVTKGNRPSSWVYRNDRTLKEFAQAWTRIDDELRGYAIKFIRTDGSFHPAAALSSWSDRIRDELEKTDSYSDFLDEHGLHDDADFNEYANDAISKMSNALSLVSRKKKSGGWDVEPEILQEAYDRDVLADGWDDLV